jgi:hypothetical protein
MKRARLPQCEFLEKIFPKPVEKSSESSQNEPQAILTNQKSNVAETGDAPTDHLLNVEE